MGQRAGIEQHGSGALGLGLVQPVEQVALMIGLAHLDGETQLLGAVLEHAGDVIQRVAAVDLRLAHAEQVEVGPVEHIDQIACH